MPKIIGIKDRIDRTYTPPEDHMDENTATQPQQLTVEAIEEFFISQGNLIEGQLKAEDVYKHCPVCAAAKEFLAGMGKMLEASLRTLEVERNAMEATRDYAGIDSLARLKRDVEWYDLARTGLAGLLQAGHIPERVMRQHPDLAVTKHQKREIRSGKHRRQLARDARRQGR